MTFRLLLYFHFRFLQHWKKSESTFLQKYVLFIRVSTTINNDQSITVSHQGDAVPQSVKYLSEQITFVAGRRKFTFWSWLTSKHKSYELRVLENISSLIRYEQKIEAKVTMPKVDTVFSSKSKTCFGSPCNLCLKHRHKDNKVNSRVDLNRNNFKIFLMWFRRVKIRQLLQNPSNLSLSYFTQSCQTKQVAEVWSLCCCYAIAWCKTEPR